MVCHNDNFTQQTSIILHWIKNFIYHSQNYPIYVECAPLLSKNYGNRFAQALLRPILHPPMLYTGTGTRFGPRSFWLCGGCGINSHLVIDGLSKKGGRWYMMALRLTSPGIFLDFVEFQFTEVAWNWSNFRFFSCFCVYCLWMSIVRICFAWF